MGLGHQPPRWLDWEVHAEAQRGCLSVVDEPAMPFAVRRFFVIEGVPQAVVRGGHAHRACQQILLAIGAGVRVKSRWSKGEAIFELASGGRALWVPAGVRLEIEFPQREGRLLVLASAAYDPDDYVADRPATPCEVVAG